MYLGLLIQDSVLYFWGFILFLCICGLGFFVYHQFLIPYMELKSNEVETPPDPGSVYEFIVNELDRSAVFTIGKNIGNITTKCSAIQDDHLVFQFKKHPTNEEYDIIIKKNGSVLIKPPRMSLYSVLQGSEKLESHEIIGKTAEFRIGGKIVKERLPSYIELSLTAKFTTNRSGKERLQFIFTIIRFHPGLNLNLPDQQGNFPFGKEDQFAKREAVSEIEEI